MLADRGNYSDSSDSNGYCCINDGRTSINDSRKLPGPDALAVPLETNCMVMASAFSKNLRVWQLAFGGDSIMTNSTRLIGLIMTATLWAGVAVAQGVPSDLGDDMPPDLSLPSLNGAS